MGLIEKVHKGEFNRKNDTALWDVKQRDEKPDYPTSGITEPGEDKIRIKIALDSGRMQIDQKNMAKRLADKKTPRALIGIPVLDHETEGGFLRGSVNLIGGGPGNGKSIFCMQYLVRGIEKASENGIFVSFEQPEEKILEDMARFKWGLEEKIRQKKLAVMYFTPEQVEKILESGSGILKDMIDFIGARRLVIDSLNAFALLYDDEIEKRKAVIRLFDLAHKWNTTTLATLERESDEGRREASLLEFETDSVLLFYNEKKKKTRVRSLEIYKMRGTNHAARRFPLNISDKGITVGKEAQ